MVKGTVPRFYMADPELRVTFSVFHLSIPVAARVDRMFSCTGSPWSNSNGAHGPIRGTIESTVAATGIEK